MTVPVRDPITSKEQQRIGVKRDLLEKLGRALKAEIAYKLDARQKLQQLAAEAIKQKELVCALQIAYNGRKRQVDILADYVERRKKEEMTCKKQIKLLRNIGKWHIDRMYLSTSVECFSQRITLATTNLAIARGLKIELQSLSEHLYRGCRAFVKARSAEEVEKITLLAAANDLERMRNEYASFSVEVFRETIRRHSLSAKIKKQLETLEWKETPS